MLYFLTAQHCELCVEAEAVVVRALAELNSQLEIEVLDIANDRELKKRFGLHIPVLLCQASNQFLGWPFTERQVAEFLRRQDVGHEV